jgi:hypothetical protein
VFLLHRIYDRIYEQMSSEVKEDPPKGEAAPAEVVKVVKDGEQPRKKRYGVG